MTVEKSLNNRFKTVSTVMIFFSVRKLGGSHLLNFNEPLVKFTNITEVF
jgi:hypothetical protein